MTLAAGLGGCLSRVRNSLRHMEEEERTSPSMVRNRIILHGDFAR